jgi:predicted esterase
MPLRFAFLVVAVIVFQVLPVWGVAVPPTSAEPPSAQSAVSSKPYAADLEYRFQPAVFDSPQFPGGSFQQDALVRAFLGPVQVTTTFYSTEFQEVKTAEAPGRYGAVVRIKLGDGTELTRFVTLYRMPKKLFWRTAKLESWMKFPPEFGINPGVERGQQVEIGLGLKEILQESTRQSSALAVILTGLSEVAPGAKPEVQRTNFWSRDAAGWWELRKRIGLMENYPYLVQLPEGYDTQPDKHWPLILFLHGSGERGDSLPKVNAQGLPKLIAAGKRFPAIIISPQCPEKEWWETPNLSQLLDDVSAKYRVDPDQITVTGLSMGGYGAWALALAYPDRFAAIAPICGGSDPTDAARLRKLPIWAFHGGKDETVPTTMSVEMVAAVHKAGGHPHLTIFPNDGHNSWTDAYNTEALYTWLLAQKRGQAEVAVPGVPK